MASVRRWDDTPEPYGSERAHPPVVIERNRRLDALRRARLAASIAADRRVGGWSGGTPPPGCESSGRRRTQRVLDLRPTGTPRGDRAALLVVAALSLVALALLGAGVRLMRPHDTTPPVAPDLRTRIVTDADVPARAQARTAADRALVENIQAAPLPSMSPPQGAATIGQPPLNAASTRAATSATARATPAQVRLHTVAVGETLPAISLRYGLLPESVAANNPSVLERGGVTPGETLRLPLGDGVVYVARAGETLASIGARYGVSADALAAERANRPLSGAETLAGAAALVPFPPTIVQRSSVPPPRAVGRAAGSSAPSASGWAWPVSGPLTSVFGPAHPRGIDVGMAGREGTPVFAPRDGVVTFVGGDPCCAYGYYVELDHGEGISSIAAHLRAPSPLRAGQRVRRGEVIGEIGNTGNSTGPHLHFEVLLNDLPVDPLAFLP